MANQLRLKVKLMGLSDVMAQLQMLPQTIANRILRPALLKATTPILATARQKARKQSGLLAKSIQRKVKTYRSSGSVVVVIGPAWGYDDTVAVGEAAFIRLPKSKKIALFPKWGGKLVWTGKRNPARMAHLIEFGHGGEFGQVQAYPFMRPAWYQNKVSSSIMARQYILQGIMKLGK